MIILNHYFLRLLMEDGSAQGLLLALLLTLVSVTMNTVAVAVVARLRLHVNQLKENDAEHRRIITALRSAVEIHTGRTLNGVSYRSENGGV